MSYSDQPVDAGGIPISSSYVPGNGFIATQGSPNISTDGQNNQSTPICLDLNQIGDLPVTMAGNDGETANELLFVAHGRYNGTTIDMDRGNMDTITLINASTITTTQTSAQQINFNGKGCIIVLSAIDMSAGPSISLVVQGVEPVTGATWNILSGDPVTVNGTYVYRIYPGLITTTSSLVANDLLPRTWQAVVTANNGNAATYMLCAIIMVN